MDGVSDVGCLGGGRDGGGRRRRLDERLVTGLFCLYVMTQDHDASTRYFDEMISRKPASGDRGVTR